MTGTKKGIVLRRTQIFIAALAIVQGASIAFAEPSYLIYPNSTSVFRYDGTRYDVLKPGDINYVPGYSVGNVMLWDKVEQRVPLEVYRAPDLVGFEQSPFGRNEYYSMSNEINVVIDGFCESPRMASNLYMRFFPVPHYTTPYITLDGEVLETLTAPLPSFRISTPIGNGYYSDTQRHFVTWRGPTAMRIVVFSDRDGNGVYNGESPLFSIFVQDNIVATEETSWGELKAKYGRP